MATKGKGIIEGEKPRGRMTAYAFFTQACKNSLKETCPSQKVNFKKFSQNCATKWKKMTDLEKQRFRDMENEDKKRYEEEKKNLRTQKRKKMEIKRAETKKRRLAQDPDAPRKPLTAYFWFSNWERIKVTEANPKLKVSDVAKQLGQMWADMSLDKKRIYEVIAERDKVRYQKEMEEYNKQKEERLAKEKALEKKEEVVQNAEVDTSDDADNEDNDSSNEEDEEEETTSEEDINNNNP